MGGSVGVAIRKTNGQEYFFEGHTNYLPSCFIDPTLYSGGKAIEEYIDFGYQQFQVIEPISYGLVVIDCQLKKIRSYQDYCSINSFFVWSLSKQDARKLLDLFEAGWITGMELRGISLTQDQIQEQFTKLKFDIEGFSNSLFRVNFNVPDWQVDQNLDLSVLIKQWSILTKQMKKEGWKTPFASSKSVKESFGF